MSVIEDQIAKLKSQLDEIQAGVEPIERDELLRAMQDERDRAIGLAEQAQRRAEEAEKKLADHMAAVQWTMGALKIADLLRMNFDADEVPSGHQSWLPLSYEPEDTARLEWINKNGRTGAMPTGFYIILPCNIDNAGNETMPEIYNIRCMIDVARKHPPFKANP